MLNLKTLRQYRVNSLDSHLLIPYSCNVWKKRQGSGRMPMMHKGPESEKYSSPEKDILNRVVFDQLLSTLSEKEQVTIEMWSQGWTLQEIARFISLEYEERTEESLLSPRTLGARVTKILQKLRFHFVQERKRLRWSEKR